MKILAILFMSLIFAGMVQAEVVTKTVEYKHGDTNLEGFLAYDDAVQGKRPGVLIIHQWNGLSDYEKTRAKQLAQMGFIAFAVDMYGKGIRPQSMEEASQQASIYRNDRPLMRARAAAGLDVLRSEELCDTKRIAVIGYCFGGGCALELARSGADVAGVVTFHGDLKTPNPELAKNIKCKLLVCHGAIDPHVNQEQVAAFIKEMNDAGVDYQLTEYSGAVHSFSIPTAGDDISTGSAYNAAADRRSWGHMQMFFNEIFK